MIPPWTQIAFLIGLTHAFRGIGKIIGPRRSGLLMGLPSTTALMLLWTGFERGPADASKTAESCLLGLVAAASVPLIYARGVAYGLRLSWIPGVAILGYLGIMLGVRLLPEPGPLGSVLLAAAGLAALCRAAFSWTGREAADVGELAGKPVSPAWIWAYRTMLPIFYLIGVRGLREIAGSSVSGLFITFPGATLAILITTHLEAGPAAVSRLALAMPFGSLSMLFFLATFRFTTPWIGLEWGISTSLTIAILTLLSVEFGQSGRIPAITSPAWFKRLGEFDPTKARRNDFQTSSWAMIRHQGRLHFSPRVEFLGG